MAKAMVEIKAATREYQSAMRQAAAEMKKLSSEYNLAATHAKLYGSESDKLRAKVTELTGKIDLQKTTVEKNKQQHENLTKQLEVQKKEHETLKEKVNAAKTAYEESAKATGKDSEETQKLKQEYENLEVRLQRSTNTIKNTETAITRQEAAINDSEAALNEFEAELREVNAELARAQFDAYAEKAGKIGSAVESVGKKLMPVTTGILAIGTAAVKTTADFDSEISKVSAISGATGSDIESLRDKAREMGEKTKFSASEAAQGMQYMAMAGWKTQEMLDGLEGIMNLAAASGEDLATTSDIVTDALTAFGLSAKDSGHFSDILAAASSNANTNVSMMGETFKYAAPVLGSLGYTAEDASLAIGLMANAGIKSSQAGTALRGAFTNLAKPTETVATAMEKYGISLTDSEGNMLSMREVMEQLREKLGGLSEAEQANAAASLFGKNAMSGMLAIINGSDADFDKLSNAIANCDGMSEQMADTMNDNLKGQITILISQLQELAISFGEILMPTIRNIVTHIQNLVDKLNNMDEGQKKNIIRIGLFAAAIAPLLIAVGKLIQFTADTSKAIGTLVEGFSKVGGMAGIATKAHKALSSAIGLLASPVGIAVAAVAGLVAVIATLWKNNEEFREAVTAIWERIKNAFQTFTQGITDRLNGLGFSFSSFTEVVSAVWNEFCNLLAPVIEGAFGLIATVLETEFDVILGIWDTFAAILSGDWSGAWEAVKSVGESIWNGIKGVFGTVLDALKGVADVFLGWFGTSWEEVWNSVKTFFEGVWNGISSFFSNIWNTIYTTVSTFVTNVYNTIKTIFDAVESVVSTIWETIKNVIQVAIMFVVELVTAAFELITLPWRFIWENCKDTLMEIWEVIKTAVSTAINAMQTTIQTVMTAIQNVMSTIWNTIKTTVTTIVTALKDALSPIWEAVKTTITTVMNTIKTTITTVWNAIKTAVTTAVNAVKSTVTTVFNAVKSTVTTIWNAIKSATTKAWDAIKGAIKKPIEAAKSEVANVTGGIKSNVKNVWDAIKSATTSTWEAIKDAIKKPIEAAKKAVKDAIDAIKDTFNFTWSLPHLKLPHISITGKFSINPPSVPHFSVEWYKYGGIMTQPTAFGMVGNTILAGGEAGEEAILPLSQFYKKLAQILDEKMDRMQKEQNVVVYVYNEMDGEEIATKTTKKVVKKITDQEQEKRIFKGK